MVAQEFIRQFVFLGGIVSGFSIAIFVQLLTLEKPRAFLSGALSSMVVSASLSFASLTIGSLLLVLLAGDRPAQLSYLMAILVMATIGLFLFGLLSFMLGLSFSCFVYSKTLGVVSSVCVGVSFLLIVILAAFVFPAL